ncbi:DUF123 domain-containing protein, partial [Halobium palmae]
CEVASALGSGPVSGFGASDCDCEAHLARRGSESVLREAVIDAHARQREK